MDIIQAARKQQILNLVDETMLALENSEISMEDLDDLICMEPPCSVEHAAYTMAMAIMGAE